MPLCPRDLNVFKNTKNNVNGKGLLPKQSVLKSIGNVPKLTKIEASKAHNDENKPPSVENNNTVSPQKRKLDKDVEKSDVKRASVENILSIDFDYDKKTSNDPNAVSEFAADIINYLKYREQFFCPGNYIPSRRNIDERSRAIVVDWLVEVQEAFEMNHETLYLAVKLFDLFLFRCHRLERGNAQLIACASVFVASKIEERSPPLIDDLIYLSKDGFTPDQLKKMERDFLKTVGYDLCSPLSYSFLRRFARVIEADMMLLTTARYILELSLHYLDFCRVSDSRMAAACLLLALRMTKAGDWSPILHKYSGYSLSDIESLMWSLNHMVVMFGKEKNSEGLKMVQDKYSHEVFYQVSATPSLSDIFPATSSIGPPPYLIEKPVNRRARRF